MEIRLQILHDTQVIDADVHQGMLAVVARLEQHWNLRIRHAQGEMMITHMANAMMRSRHGDIIPAIDNEVLTEIVNSDAYANILEIHHDLLNLFTIEVPEYEQGYLLANIYGLVLAQEESIA